MKVDDVIKKLREISEKGYGQTEIIIDSDTEYDAPPNTLDYVCLYEHNTKQAIVEFEVS